ncbi:hypothetical protein Q5752_002113 [Cryptotrichosporon argae]
MPSPPLSPVPRRWRSPEAVSGASPDVQRLYSSLESDGASSQTNTTPFFSPREEPADYPLQLAPGTPTPQHPPEIRTTSPSPGRPASPARSSEGRISPLIAHAPGHQHGGLARFNSRGSLAGPRGMGASPLAEQPTGGSFSARYDDVLAQLDRLENPTFAVRPLAAPAGTQPPTAFVPGRPAPQPPQPQPSPSPTTSAQAPPPAAPAPFTPARPMYVRLGDSVPLWRPSDPLDAVSERTEPLTSSASGGSSPSFGHNATPQRPVTPASGRSHAQAAALHAQVQAAQDTPSTGTIASRFPLPPSPVKGPRTAAATPKKASELIRMFESQNAGAAASTPPPLFPRATRIEQAADIPPSTYRTPESAPTPPPKSTSPLQAMRTMVASWRARTGSPQRQAPADSGDRPLGLGRDKTWNVSIRRRRRDDVGDLRLAQHEEDEGEVSMPGPEDERLADPLSVDRSASVRSIASRRSGPRSLTGEPIRTGTLYYLNVHDIARVPNFQWVRADARLFPEGLQLVWRTPTGAQAMVTLDLDYCEEVASTYSPSHPAAGDDIGARAARDQGLADGLYPFKLVYDDGTERLGCESASDRVRWVNAIWTALEHAHTRGPAPTPSVASRDRGSQASASTHGGGSASTHYAPVATAPDAYAATTDDAVIETAGGFAAPLTARGSRRLGAHAERARSLRRVASEADLVEAINRQASPAPPPLPSPHALAPLTTAEARSRPASRDFTFAGGIPPPPLSPPAYTSPTSPTATRPLASAADYFSPSHTHYSTAPGTDASSSTALPTRTRAAPGAYPASTGDTATELTSTYGTGPPASTYETAQPASAYGTAPLGSAYSSARPGSVYGSAQPASTYGTARPGSTYGSAAPVSASFGTATGPPSTYGSAAPASTYGTAAPASTYGTAAAKSEYSTADAVVSPARTSVSSEPMSLRTALNLAGQDQPRVAVTAATPSEGEKSERAQSYHATVHPLSTYDTAQPGSSYEATRSQLESAYATAASGRGTVYATAPPPSTYTTAPPPPLTVDASDKGSEVARTARDSVSTYDTAPPPVPSRDSHYSTATLGSTSASVASPIRHQLYDAPVRTLSELSVPTPAVTAREPTEYFSARPPTTRATTATEFTVYQTAGIMSDSQYSTARPPISRAQSFPSDVQENASWETGTHVSEPDTDYALIADLERRSSAGSERRSALHRSPAVRTAYATAATASMYAAPATATVYGTAREGSAYDTARDSAYATASQGRTAETYMTTAFSGTNATYQTAKTSQTRPAISVSTAQSLSGSSNLSRKPVPPLQASPPPPPPPPPSDPSGPTSSSSSSTHGTTTSGSTQTHPAPPDYDMMHLINYLQGQEQARQGQTTRLTSQLDRIEGKVDKIATAPVPERPPPVPSKDDDSPPPSPSSTTSTSSSSSSSSLDTARPVTPPPLVLPPSLTQRLDDMTHLLGTVLGQQSDIMHELARRRTFDVELDGSRNITLPRIEDLLRRLLLRVGDSEYGDDIPLKPRVMAPAHYRKDDDERRSVSTRPASMDWDGRSVFSDEAGHRAPARPSSEATSRRRADDISTVPSSLLKGDVGSPDFDDDFAVAHLPPASPPHEHATPRPAVAPPAFRRRQQAPPPMQPVQEEYEYPQEYEDEYEPEPEPEPEPSPEQEDEAEVERSLPSEPIEDEPEHAAERPPVPYVQDEYDEDSYEDEAEEAYARQPSRRLPPPQPVDLPTPVGEEPPRPFPGPQQFPPSMQQQFMPGSVPDMPPRPSLPRIAGVRDPISTTYFRRNFPPGAMGPMGMGMFPGPMGMPGPGMGPFMPGLRPGLAGFGGPLGPNVAPGPRRPGFFPPGVTSTTGDYGLPAAARYGNMANVPGAPAGPYGPPARPPPLVPDNGLGNTTTETSSSSSSSLADTTPTSTPSVSHSLTPTTTEDHLLTPVTAATPLAPPIIATQPLHGDLRHTLDDAAADAHAANALAEAQGEQQNAMSRYLHGMSDQIADARDATQKELADILADIANLRTQLRPERVFGHVLPDGTVQLSTGEIVDGIRGPPPAVAAAMTPMLPLSPAASHVLGKVLPDGTVMVGDKIVDGIKGAPHVAEADEDEPQAVRDAEQDRRLADLQDKIAELMARTGARTPTTARSVSDADELASTRGLGPTPRPTPRGPNTDITREKTYIKEREVIREGPSGHHREYEKEDNVELDLVTTVPPPGTGAPWPVAGTVPPGTAAGTMAPPPGTLAGTGPAGTFAGTGAPGNVPAPGTVGEPVTVVATGPGGTIAATGDAAEALLHPDDATHDPLSAVADEPHHAHAGTVLPAGATVHPSVVGAGTTHPWPGSVHPSAAGSRINPRTGKPLTIPAPLSLKPTQPSPIVTEQLGDPADNGQMIREEHEEAISHPLNGGPPLHTHTTTRTYSGAPGPGAGSGGSSVTPTAYGDVPAGLQNPALAPGAHHSDHVSVSARPPTVVPFRHSEQEELLKQPGTIPVDTHHSSVSASRHPAAYADPAAAHDPTAPGSLADPAAAPSHVSHPATVVPAGSVADPAAGTVVGDPAGATPAAPAKEKETWSTNRPKHPRDSALNDPSNAAGAPAQDPVHVSHNVPTAQPEADPAAPVNEADAPAPPAKASSGKGVHWESRVPEKDVVQSQHNVPSAKASKPPSVANDAPAVSGHGAADPVVEADPSDAGVAHHDADGAAPGGVSEFEEDVEVPKSTKSSRTGVQRKPVPSLESTKATAAPAGSRPASVSGPPVVSTGAAGEPLAAGDKDTRFSDVVHPRAYPAGQAHDPPELPSTGAGGVLDDASAASVHDARPLPSADSGKLRKGKTTTEAEPGADAPPDGPEMIPVFEEMTLPDGKKALIQRGSIPSVPASRPASRAPTIAEPPAASVAAPAEVDAPAGSNKLRKSTPSTAEHDEVDKDNEVVDPVSGKAASTHTHKSASIRDPAAPAVGVPAESEVGKGHCSYCCPNDARPGLAAEVAHAHDPTHTHVHDAEPTPAPSKLSKKTSGPPSVHPIDGLPGAQDEADATSVKSSSKSKDKKSSGLSPEEELLEDAKKLAAKQKAAAEAAAAETAEKEKRQQEKADKAKLAEDRHKQMADALAELRRALDGLAGDQKTWRTSYDESAKTADKRRADKAARDKKWQEALDKLVGDKDEQKKLREADAKKPGTQAILDALKTSGDAQSAFLRKLATEVMEQNSNQHKLTQDAAKQWAREQVGFNLAGYLDDFSKALSGEVRVLLKEVGDLRESRRALYMELAELLLMKGRQSTGDLMAVLPYPAKPPTKVEQKKQDDKKPAQPGGGGNISNKQPAVPAWASYMVPPAPVTGLRPLPQPAGAVPPPPAFGMLPMPVPDVPHPSAPRPLPQPKA